MPAGNTEPSAELPDQATTTLYLIRHGQIQANIDHIWHGSTDSDLTPLGEQQAVALGKYLSSADISLSAIYTSPLSRTRRTAELVAQAIDLTPQPEPGLVEYGIGEYEGIAYDTLLEMGFFERIEQDPDYTPKDGESLVQVVDRMLDVFNRLAVQHEGKEIALVSHGAAMGLALSRMLDGKLFPFHRYHMDNTAVSKLVIGKKPELIYFNKSDHMD